VTVTNTISALDFVHVQRTGDNCRRTITMFRSKICEDNSVLL
jgi:hypothetical protein